MQTFVKVCKALSDPSRVKILKMLQHRVMCVCELTQALGLAQPTVSKHLKALENAGLVSSSRDEKWVNYQLADGTASPYASSMLGNLRHWLDDEREVRELLESLSSFNRETICG